MLKKKLLLADDDVDDRTFFLDFFQGKNDFELMPPAENGLELIDILNNVINDNELPHLIVIDQNMPRMNGLQTLEYLKNTTRYANIPVIIYSTYKNDQLETVCSKSGAALVASKPTSYQGYQSMIKSFLQILS